MSTTYEIQPGDTLESIARKQYGNEAGAKQIEEANPGLNKTLIPGTQIITPAIPGTAPDVIPQISANNENEVAVIIEGQVFRFWESIQITRSIDAMDTVEFTAPFDAEAPGFKETFEPFSFKPLLITVGGNALFTGTMVAVTPNIQNKKKIISVSCYSTPGVLNDCTPPASAFPLEYNNQGLRDIAASLVAPFGITTEFIADQGDIFPRVACPAGAVILRFLIDLAQQRNLIISSSSDGKLVFWQSVDGGSPVAFLSQGNMPFLALSSAFSPQEYYSHITGIEPVIVGSEGSQFTVKNPRLQGVVRPFNFSASDTETGNLKTAVEAKSGRMFGNMASYSLKVSIWRDSSGKLWEPNTTIKLIAPEAMIYSEYEFVIRSIVFHRQRASETATLNLVIPGSFNGKIPEVLPWEN